LNLPGAPDGAAYDGDKIMASIFTGRKRLAPEKGVKYFAFVDMSGGSSDDAVLGISRFDAELKNSNYRLFGSSDRSYAVQSETCSEEIRVCNP
jgi:hypothetical protein